jgi:hypothetical protein
MIGHDSSSPAPQRDSGWERLGDFVEDVVEFVQDIARAIWEWVETVVDIVRWVRVIVQQIYGVPMERWITRNDEHTCPQCGGLDGQVWERGEGEYPPAHNNCRCSREYAFTEWRTRDVTVWQRQHQRIVTGGWQITSWS